MSFDFVETEKYQKEKRKEQNKQNSGGDRKRNYVHCHSILKKRIRRKKHKRDTI